MYMHIIISIGRTEVVDILRCAKAASCNISKYVETTVSFLASGLFRQIHV